MSIPLLFGLLALTLGVVGDETPEAQSPQSACASLQSLLGATIVQTPAAGSSFQTIVGTPLNLANNELTPSCVVIPQNTSHVSTAMKAIYKTKSRYAVLAGGHSAMKGWNAVRDGVLIYFRDMKAVSYDSRKDTITMQPGVRWGEAVNTLAPLGVAPVGGRAAHVGSGFLLGGGISFLSPSLGYGADLYKELDVVLVDGSVVTATANNKYSDLFRALKGGANRFGIVTRYELYPFHSGKQSDKTWFGGTITYPGSFVEDVLRATARYTKNVDDPNATIFVTLEHIVNAPANKIDTVVQANIFYHGKSLPPKIFGDFLSIPASNKSLSALSYADIVANTFPANDDHGSTYLYGASTRRGGDEKAFVDALNFNLNFTESLKRDLAWTALTFTPIPDSQIKAGRARGGNAIDAPLTGGYAVMQIMQTLPVGVVDVPPAVANGKKKLLSQIKPVPGLPLFINECDALQNVFATYGGYDFLKKTYKKYDPTRFNIGHTDGPIGL
ncbi:hypothetical protein BDZ94DRAFT_770917 [Collybia nuda]|uniref:FAD-binding PCMH-type domain-containing protein n=1 Tax=Collybia nuda TaxID=64659 RepID=A0A9P6CDN9_9AGAR|nr:hypothetical protein BDZ94DRAFT_770917 [Collybia nuda]